jgi:hypothetical protein
MARIVDAAQLYGELLHCNEFGFASGGSLVQFVEVVAGAPDDSSTASARFLYRCQRSATLGSQSVRRCGRRVGVGPVAADDFDPIDGSWA